MSDSRISRVVDVFCRVVDNFGDIGVAYRLTRTLQALRPQWKFRLTVDNLLVFGQIEPRISPHLDHQFLENLEVIRWNDESSLILNPPPEIVIENFGSGWPHTFNSQLFDPQNPTCRIIINVDYLSAEDYAQEYHQLPSLSSLPQVKKFFFMPGFTPGTGGLLLGNYSPTTRCLPHSPQNLDQRISWARELDLNLDLEDAQLFWISLFTYEQDFLPLITSIKDMIPNAMVLVPAGRGSDHFFQDWEPAGRPFRTVKVPFQSQSSYDLMVSLCDFNVVRGEDSLVRACVSGRPFLWHAYQQESDYQRVKVDALLETMKPFFFQNASWPAVKNLFLGFNHTQNLDLQREVPVDFSSLFGHWEEAKDGFRAFSEYLWENGDLGEKLIEFLEKQLLKNP